MMGRGDRKEVIRLWEDMVAKAKGGGGGEADSDTAGSGLGSGVLPTQAAAAELFKACELEVVMELAAATVMLHISYTQHAIP